MVASGQIVKTFAKQVGFDLCGISKASFLEEEAPRLETWLQNGYHGKMNWMENHFDKRLDPTKLVPGAKSVVSVLLNYFPEEEKKESDLKISKYAYGKDYHYVIKDKLKQFIALLETKFGKIEGRMFVDSAPVLDRAWAAKSGLGWIGKHSLVLNKGRGSFFFIAELIIDLEIETDLPVTDHCGTCTACIDACPTDAIISDKIIDSTKCISYLTIELKEEIPQEFKNKMEGWVFGCDICQDVCPWNRFSKPTKVEALKPTEPFNQFYQSEWKELTSEVFKEVFKKSAIKRAGYMKLKNSIDYCSQE